MRFNERGRWLACSGVGGGGGEIGYIAGPYCSAWYPLRENALTHQHPGESKREKKKGLQGDTIIKSKHIFFLRWQLLLAALSMTHSYIGEGFSVT